jgi:uncharacterized protein YjbJ (UPF0337 family)
MSVALSCLVSLPKPTGPQVAQFLAAGTCVVDPLPTSKQFPIPVVAGAHRDAESVARLPNRLAVDEHQLIKRRLLRLRRVVDSSPEDPIDDEASLAIRIHAAPGSRTGTVASSTLCFPSTEDAWGIGYNGAALGSHANAEARIDSIAQSWAVTANASPARTRRALESADQLLVDETNQLVRLFTPPFDRSTPHPGYIMGYPPGLRENGGQYTHGALWTALAWARLGEGSAAVRLLTMMNPVEHSRTPDKVAHYRGEPYSAAADVSSAAGRAGQTGWTWYTGSAAWMYRIWIEEVLGFHLRGDQLTLRPAIPEDWPGFEITYRYRSATYRITVQKDPSLDLSAPEFLHLIDDGASHSVLVRIPSKAASQLQSNNGAVHSGPAPPSKKGNTAMNWDQIEGKWKQIKGSAKQQWGKLTDDDLDFISGSKDKLIGRLQERYGIQKEDAQARATAWLDSVPTMPEETSTRR